MDKNDDFRKDIDDIKSDIFIIKNSIASLSLEFNTHIQDHSATTNKTTITAALVHDVRTDISIKNNVDTNDSSTLGNLIDYSFIKNNDTNKSLLEVLSVSNRNMTPLYEKDFLHFCSCAVGLIEDVIKIFLKNKFFEENNDRLLKACDLVEQKYPDTKPNKFPDIYISKNKYNAQNVNDYYYHPKREEYLSLDKLKGQDIYFKLDLCFVILYGEDFYNKPYSVTPTINRKKSNQVFKRPSPKLTSSIEPCNKNFYYRIDNARKFRNIFTHNPYNPNEQQEELTKELSNYYNKKLKNDLDNYDGILEAVNWFIRQIYIDMTKN